MADDLDPEQQGAAEHAAGSLVLSAGAGSGKTRVLVARYLKHLADGVPVAKLAAITFTDKAAREMRQRIRKSIRERQTGPDAATWKTHERHLETAAIDTIHGFCTGLLKKHAAAAGLSPDFEVLSENLTAVLRNEVVVASLQRLLLAETAVGEDLRELIVLHGWRRIVEAAEEFLREPDPARWRAFADEAPETIAQRWTKIAADTAPAYAADRIDGISDIVALNRVEAKTPEGRQILAAVLAGLQRLREDPATADVPGLLEIARVGNHHAAKKLYGEDNYPTVKDGYEAIRKLIGESSLASLLDVPEDLPSAAAVAQRMARVAVVVASDFTRRKQAQQQLDFHDLLTWTRDLLRDNAVVRDAVRDDVQFLLLDELQDTDPVQMELIELTLGDRVTTGGLFAVGDVKQSIYRFRGAEVALFRALRDRMPAESRRSLTRNYRSRPSLIAFVNALCREWFDQEPPLVATQPEGDGPAVEFLWAVADGEKPVASDLRHAEAAAIAERIVAMLGDSSPVKTGDIVLLFRALTNVSIYEDALRGRGIDYYLVGGRAFFAQQEVYDLANVLRAIENPNDHVALVGVLRSPIGGLSDDAVTAICLAADDPWTGLMGDLELVPPAERDAARRARRNLTTWRQQKDSLPLARLLQRILADSGYDAALLFEPLGDRKLANLWKLQSLAREFDAAGYDLARFAHHLEDQVRRQPREDQAATVPEEAAHVVRIMSIHQAKGLEFPVVFVPDLGGGISDSRSPAARWHRRLGALVSVPGDDEEYEVGYPGWPATLGRILDHLDDRAETLRTMYVACTRARSKLVLSSGVADGPPIEPAEFRMEALARAFDLTTGTCHNGESPAIEVRIIPRKP